MALKRWLLAAVTVPSLAKALAVQNQMPLATARADWHGNGGNADVIKLLKEAEIIPDVLEAFAPKVDIAVHWPDATARLGNLISPGELHDAPKVHLTAVKAAYHHDLKGQQLTLALSDPDAPSRDNPKWSEVCHWLITSLPLHSPSSPSSLAEDLVAEMAKATDLVEYKPPGPPEKTGKHRYVLVLMAPKNGTKAGLDLEAPSGRQHWGFESHQRRVGVGRWMREMGLEVVGANFIYAEHKKQ